MKVPYRENVPTVAVFGYPRISPVDRRRLRDALATVCKRPDFIRIDHAPEAFGEGFYVIAYVHNGMAALSAVEDITQMLDRRGKGGKHSLDETMWLAVWEGDKLIAIAEIPGKSSPSITPDMAHLRGLMGSASAPAIAGSTPHALKILIDPGQASESLLVEVMDAISELNVAFGGQGLLFVDDEAGTKQIQIACA